MEEFSIKLKKLYIKKFFYKIDFFSPYIGGLFLLISHLVVFIKREWPVIIADETGVLMNAVHLHTGNSLEYTEFANTYPVGYSLLISPIMFVKDVFLQYRLVLLFNITIAMVLYGLLYGMLKTFFYKKKKNYITLIALAISFYPAVFHYTHYTISEALYIPLQFFVVYSLFLGLYKKKDFGFYLFGSLSMFSYFVRGNGISTVIACMLIAILFLLKRKYAILIKVVFSMLCSLLILSIVKSNVFVGHTSYQDTSPIRLFLNIFKSRNDFYLYIREVAGQFFYISTSTFLIVPMVILCFVKQLLRKGKKLFSKTYGNIYILYSFILLAFLGTFCISTVFMRMGLRGDHMFYGRYNEGYIVPLLLLGFYILEKIQKDRIFKFMGMVITILSINNLLPFIARDIFSGHGINYVTILSFIPYLYVLDLKSTYTLSFIITNIVVIMIIVYTFRRKTINFVFCLALLLQTFLINEFFVDSLNKVQEKTQIVKYFSNFNLEGKDVYYDMNYRSTYEFFTYDYYFQSSGLIKVYDIKNIKQGFIITSDENSLIDKLNLNTIVQEKNSSLVLTYKEAEHRR